MPEQSRRPVRSAPRGPRVTPLYHQLYVQLREQLTDGSLDPGRPIPSEPTLASRFGVSRVTVRRTLDELEREGLIRRERGVGTFPMTRQEPPARANISGLLDNLLTFEANSSAQNLAWGSSPVPPELLEAFGEGTCLRILRVRSYEGRPISLTTIHVPAAHAGLLDETEVGPEPIVKALERRGVLSATADQIITAVAAPDMAVEHLGVAAGSPLICMRRLMLTGERKPVLHQESLYAPDRFEYRMTLSRMSVGPIAKWTPIA